MLQEQTAESVLADHRARLRPVDRVLPDAEPLAEPAEGEELLEVPGGTGLLNRTQAAPDQLEAVLGPLDRWELTPRVAGPAGMAALLERWQDHMESHPDRPGKDSMASVEWPSRDVEMTGVLRESGFVPDFVMAGRVAGNDLPREPGKVHVRRATPDDADAVLELQMVETRFDASVSGAVERENTERLLRAEHAESLKLDQPWIWVAEYEDKIVGMNRIEDPSDPQQAWLATKLNTTPVAHMICHAVDKGYRGLGVGTSIANHIHAELDRMGIGSVVGYYAMFNPLSVPFWHRCGWRPFWTRWVRTPAA